MPAIARQIHQILEQIEVNKRIAHFSRLPHEAKVAFAECIGARSIKTISICVNKRVLQTTYTGHTLGRRRRLYFYVTRFLLERISWIARDHKNASAANPKCKLIFSKCKNLSYVSLAKYLDDLQDTATQIAWDYIDLAAIEVQQHNNSLWLKVADAVASGTEAALELNRFGHCEDRYVLAMSKALYRYQDKKCQSYGLKFFPSVPKKENGRYRWIATVSP